MKGPSAPAFRRVAPDALVAVLAGVAGVVGSYAAAGFTPGFVVAPIESYLAVVTPGVVVTFAITVLGDLGQKVALAGALVLSALLLASVSLVGVVFGRGSRFGLAGGLLVLPAVWGLTAFLTGAPVLALGAALPPAAVVVLAEATRRYDGDRGPTDPARRGVLATGLAVGAFAVVGSVLGRTRTPRLADDDDVRPESRPLLAEAERKSLDVAGLEPLVSDRFYQVDINSVDPTIDRESWSLRVTGAVDEEVEFDYADVTARPAREEFNTLRCVGESLNGRKTDNALWTVTDVMPFVEEAGLPDGPCCVMLRAEDGFFEEFPLEALEDGVLAYGMNGRDLPRGHGAPVRALIPGHWGEINVKWLTEIEILEQEAEGYWEKRGWHGTGPVIPVAKLHAVNSLDDGRKEVAGHAYAGVRGVSRVEVSTDGGDSWNEATLSERLPGRDVWRQWVYRYEPPAREHEVVVRMYDDDGTVQPSEESNAFPSGPSGWVSRRVRP
jgi:DMSO/TMAO reductase YedYZ molybdopterin-dependent catalytic subunit